MLLPEELLAVSWDEEGDEQPLHWENLISNFYTR
jgi:hypothetical protein